MKLICLQENLNHGLSVARVAISKNTTLPIVNNFLLEAKNGQLIVLSTNLEIGIETIIRGKVEKEGIITVPATILTNFINGLPNKKVTLELENNLLNISCEGFKARLNGISAEDFPLIPKTKEENSVSIDASELKTALNQVISAASTSDIRPELAGMFVKIDGKNMTLAATDSFRLAEKVLDIINENGIKYTMIVPSKTILELTHIIEPGEKVHIFKDENQVLFKIGATKLTSRLIEAEYPDYPQIIPTSSTAKIVVNKQELLKNVKVAGIFSNSRVNDVKVNISDNVMQVRSNTPEVGENASRVNISKSEGEVPGEEIVYNYHSLIDGLNNIISEEVIIELNGDIGPTILRPTSKNDYLYITKPLKIT